MRAQRLIGLVERALGVQVEIGIGELRPEAVGIFDLDLAAVPQAERAGGKAPARRSARRRRSPAVCCFTMGQRWPPARTTSARFGLRQKGAHLPAGLPAALAHAVRSQNAERVAVIPAHYRFNLFSSHESLKDRVWPISSQEMPKAELHVHLEGSLEPETLRELDPATPLEELRALYRYTDFNGFLKAFGEVGKRLRTPRTTPWPPGGLLERLAGQNVRYAEIILAAGVVLWKGQDFDAIFEAVAEAAAGSPVEVRWILDGVRQFGVEHVMAVAKLAAERVDRGVVAFGIGGSEERGPAEWFTDVFAFAADAGLHLTAHAGEGTGPQAVWSALRLGAERIGHGISAVEDPELDGAPARGGYSAGDFDHEQPGDGCGAMPRGASCAAPLRRGRSDRAEHRRSGDVRLHAGRRIPPGGSSVWVQREGTAGDCGERVPIWVSVGGQTSSSKPHPRTGRRSACRALPGRPGSSGN